MQGLSQPWQTKGAILPQSNLIQAAWIAVSITRIEIIIMCVKEKLHFQIYVISFHFIECITGWILLSSHINILNQIAKLNCFLIYCRGIKTYGSSALEQQRLHMFAQFKDAICQTWTREAAKCLCFYSSAAENAEIQMWFGGKNINLCD